MGEAAGTACCLSLDNDVTPRSLDVKTLQRELVKAGGNLGQTMRDIPGLDIGKDMTFDGDKNMSTINNSSIVTNRKNEFTR